MNVTSIVIAIAVIAFVLARRIGGEAVPVPKKLLLLPAIVSVVGVQNLSHVTMNTVDIGIVVAGSVVSLSLGLLRGQVDKLSLVNGSPYMSWGATSLIVFALNIVAKVVLDVAGVAMGGTTHALTSSVLLSLGLTLLGEAAVILMRAQSLTKQTTTGNDQYRGGVHPPDRPIQWPPIR
jgi:hypothetical protein